MIQQKGRHALDLVVVLSRAIEDVVVPSSFVIHSLHRLSSRARYPLKLARHLDVRGLGAPRQPGYLRCRATSREALSAQNRALQADWDTEQS